MIQPQPPEDDKEFLGCEFLTWLWYRVEASGGVFELEDIGRVGLAFDRSLELRDLNGIGKVIVSADAVTRTPEAATALSCGKLVSKARLVVGIDEENFEMTIDGPTLDVGGLKFAPIVAEDAFELEIEKLERLWTASALVYGLFEMFLTERLSPQFESSTLVQLQDWVQKREKKSRNSTQTNASSAPRETVPSGS